MTKKVKLYLWIFIPVSILTIAIGVYLIKITRNAESSDLNESNEEIFPIENYLNPFPELNKNHFYQYLRVINGEVRYSDIFKAKVISYVIAHTDIPDGDLNYWVNERADRLEFNFMWEDLNHHVFYKNYLFNLTKV